MEMDSEVFFVFDFDFDKHDVNSIFIDKTEINVSRKLMGSA
jgi:hypothetical protein